MKSTNSLWNDGYGLSFNGTDGRLTFWVNNYNGSSAVTTPTAIPLNAWTRIDASYDGVMLRLYVNGTLVASQSYTVVITHSTAAFQIGKGAGAAGQFVFNGLIDEVGIYNTALTPAQAAALAPGGATYRQTGGSTTLNGSLLSGATDTVQLLAGTLKGTGTVNGSLVNAGTVAPGNSPGFIDITGDYTQTAAGVLDLEIAGRDPNVPQFDRLRVTGTATLAGTVRLSYLDGFQPAPGDSFRVLSAASRVGQFAAHQFPAPGGPARTINPIYDATGLTLLTQVLPAVEFAYATTQTSVPGNPLHNADVVADAAGNAYLTGYFTSGVADLDAGGPAPALTSLSTHAGYVAKFDPAGNLLWQRMIEGGAFGDALGIAVALDPTTGDVLFIGQASGSVSITDGTTTASLPGSIGTRPFVVRLTSAGNVVWGRSTETSSTFGDGHDVAVGPTGTAYVTGSFVGTVDFDPAAGVKNLTAAGGGDAFVWALDAAGNFVAADRLGGAGEDIGQGVAVTTGVGGDAVWLTGWFQGSTTGLAALTSNGTNDFDAYVLKVSPSGTGFTTAFAAGYGGPGTDLGRTIGVGADGSPVVGGEFEFSADFDTAAGRDFTLTSAGDSDAFLLKLDAAGGFVWARGFGGYRDDAAFDLSLDPAGNVYAAGYYTDFVDFDPLDGSYILQAANPTAFAAKYTPAGAFGWAADLAPTGGAFSFAEGIAASAGGRVVVAGDAVASGGTIDFDPGPGTNFPIPTGKEAGFVWGLRQKAAPQVTIAGLPAGAVGEGSTLALAASVVDPDSPFVTYSWSVTRNGETFANGTGGTFGAFLADQGLYAITLVVTDESGNTATATATVAATNAAPVLNPTAFAAGVALTGGTIAVGDNVGAVMASGNGYVLVGNPLAGATDTGSVRVYLANGTFRQTLTSPSPVASGLFGSAVAVVGSRLVVGEPGAAGGAVHVYEFNTGTSLWVFARTITGPGSAAGDEFGAAVAAVGNLMAVGAPGRDTNAGADVGAAYLFDPAAGQLAQTFYNPTPAAGDEFGTAVVAVGGNVLIGAPGDDAAGLNAGAVYLMEPGFGRLVREVFNPNPSLPDSRFGGVLAASGTRAAVGAPLDDSNGTDSGGAFLYDLDPSSPAFGTLRVTGAGKLGSSLALTPTRAVVGAIADGGSGSVFVFDADPRSATFKTSLLTLKKATPAAGDEFGAAVALVGDDVWAGAPKDDTAGADAGAAYRFAASAFVTRSATSIIENGSVTVAGSFSDSGATDAHIAVIEWGDGAVTRLPLAAGLNTFGATHQYLDDDPTATPSDAYSVRVRVEDTTPDLLVTYLSLPVGSDVVSRFDGTTGAGLGTFLTTTTDQVAGVAAGPDGFVYVALYDGANTDIVRVDPATGASLGTFVNNATTFFDPAINNLVFGPDGTLYLRGGSTVLVRFDGTTGAAIPAPGGPATLFNSATPAGLTLFFPHGFAFGPDGNIYVGNSTFIFPGTLLAEIDVFDGTTGGYLRTVPPPAGGDLLFLPDKLAFGPDGTLYVLADESVAGTQRVVTQLDVQTGEVLRRFDVNPTSTAGLDDFLLGPDDTLIYSSPNRPAVDRYSLTTGEFLGSFPAAVGGGHLANVVPQDTNTAPLTVTNAAPVVTVRAARNATPGQYTLAAVVADPGTRDTFTYSWTITGGTAVGATNGSSFTFTPTAGTITVTLTVTDDDTGTVTCDTRVIIGTAAGETITVANPPATIEKVIVYGLGGNDTINAGGVTTVPVELIGGAGSDTLVGGGKDDLLIGNSPGDYTLAFTDPANDKGDDSLSGGAGNDTLDGGLGNDTMTGGTGNDYFIQVPGSDDLLIEDSTTGAGSIDTIDYTPAYYGITFSLAKTGTAQVVNAAPPVGDASTVTIQGVFENVTGSGFGDDLTGSSIDNQLLGGGGDDRLFGGDLLDSLAAALGDGNDTIAGGSGNDTAVGGSGNDIIFGGDVLAVVAGDGNDSLVGGLGNDTVVGGAGNDIVFGSEGDDALSGGTDTDMFEGGSGTDRLFETADADMILTPTTLTIGGVVERIYDIEQAVLTGGAGNNLLDAHLFPGPVALSGAGGNDTLVGSDFADVLAGGSGNDSLVGNAGGDVLDPGPGTDTSDGGDGNDTYLVTLAAPQTLIDTQGIDSIDLSSAAFAVDVDLDRPAPQILDTAGVTATLVGAFENVRGTSYGDVLKGTAARNILEGGGGVDAIDGRDEADTVQASFPQVIYLDFDSATGRGEHAYTIEERNQIQARLEADYAAPFSVVFSQTAPAIGRFTTVVVNAGESAANEVLVAGLAFELDWRNVNAASRADINVNGFLGRRGQPVASSANYVALTATVTAHEIGHLLGLRHSDSFGPVGINPGTGLPYGIFAGLPARSAARDELLTGTPAGPLAVQYQFKKSPVLLTTPAVAGATPHAPVTPPTGTVFDGPTAVANFTVLPGGNVQVTPIGTPVRVVLGGTFDPNTGGLALQWSAPPPTSSVRVTYQYDAFRPGYRGPLDATETRFHMMASPAAVGSSIADALEDVYFGERELIKLAFADTANTLQETALPNTSSPLGSARNLGTLSGLAVPNLLPTGAANAGRMLNVRATSVVGNIGLNGPFSENDVYAVQGRAGELLSAEVLSFSIRQRVPNQIDSVVRVYDSLGNLLNFYGRPAENDDGFDNQDALLHDVLLPTDGTYYVVVDTFSGGPVPDTDTGGYELFVHMYANPQPGAPRLGGAGDLLTGGAGRDVLVGGVGDDRFNGSQAEDIFIGFTPEDIEGGGGGGNTPPSATVQLDTASPRTNDTLTATAAVTDPDAGDVVTLTYVWRVNGVEVARTENTTSLTDTFSLATPGNGDKGDEITVEVTPNDGTANGTTASASATVANTAPTATVNLNTASPRTNDTLTATATRSDVDASDTVTFTYVWRVNGVVRQTTPNATSLTDTFDLSVVGNGDKGQTVTVEVTPDDGTEPGVPVFASATVGNTAPTATVALTPLSPRTNDVLTATATRSDADTDPVTLTYRWYVGTTLVKTTPNTPALTDTLDLGVAGNGDKGQMVRVEVTPNDGTANGAMVSSSAVVQNAAPTSTVVLNTAAPKTNDVLTATATKGDADGDPVTLTYVWKVNGVEKRSFSTTALTDSFDLGVAGNGDVGQAITVEVTPNDGTANGSAASASAIVANSGPTAVNDSSPSYVSNPNPASLAVAAPGVLANDTDPDSDSLTVISFTQPAHGGVTVAADGSFTYSPAGGYTGSDSFTYTISDGRGGTSAATVQVLVNTPPAVQITGAPAGNVPEGSPITLGSSATDPNPAPTARRSPRSTSPRLPPA